MKTVAVYSLKGGVGKTTLAVNLAWAAARLSSRQTLLWDLDPQAAATFLFAPDAKGDRRARAGFTRDIPISKLVVPTAIQRLSLIPSDTSLRSLNHVFDEAGKKRLAKLLEEVSRNYDRAILDCPPGLNETTEQVLRAADLIVVPVIPSPLSQRALEEVCEYLDQKKMARSLILPVFNMVDRRRSLHLETLAVHPKWPAIPMASAFEAMSAGRQSIGGLAPGSTGALALARLWRSIESRLASTYAS